MIIKKQCCAWQDMFLACRRRPRASMARQQQIVLSSLLRKELEVAIWRD
jgi:hypothetical protein